MTAYARTKRSTAFEGDSPPTIRWTVAQYHGMIAAGILGEDDAVELLEGEVVLKMPKNPAHENARRMLRRALDRMLGESYFVDDQSPVTTADSEPEPDLHLIRGRVEEFANRHPTPKDSVIVIEVSESTLRTDRGRKQRIYARAGVGEYWIVNLVDRVVEVYRGAKKSRKEPAYARRQDYAVGQFVPVVIDGIEIGKVAVAKLMPTH